MSISDDLMRAPATAWPRGQIDSAVSRSWLLVSGARSEKFSPALASDADEIIIDLEDGVGSADKHSARQSTLAWLTSSPASAWVRINDRRSPYWEDDVAALRGAPGVKGVMLAKTESGHDVTDTFERLDAAVPVLALIESALGIEEAVSIARAPGTFRIAFGSGDYRHDTGTGPEDLALAYPRSRLVIASRVAQLPGPIDGPTVGALGTALRNACSTSVSLGLTGKLCLAHEQAIDVNDALSPAAEDIEWALETLEAFEARGRTIRDGSDLPRVGRAQKTVELAQNFGLIPTI